MLKRSAAILMPLTSLPDNAPIGLIGKEAYHFIDHLSSAGITYWQMLPVNLFDQYGCPYASPSAFGGNPLLLSVPEIDVDLSSSRSKIDFNGLYQQKMPLLEKWARSQIDKNLELIEDFKSKYFWASDLCVFLILKKIYGDFWTKWPKEYLNFENAQNYVFTHYKDEYHIQLFLQAKFHEDWNQLKDYAHKKGIKLIGDIPIFVSAESFDSWRFRSIFKIDQNSGEPSVITGAPPDDFSKDGQLWGTINYAWDNPEALPELIQWWKHRLSYGLELFDLIRIDHFIGVYHVWESPYGEKTAVNGKWVKGNGHALLSAIKEEFPHMPFIAEDLGALTQEVTALREEFKLPSMKVFQFSISDDAKNEHLPHLAQENTCYYSGTHDNNTLKGWRDQESKSSHFVKLLESRFGKTPSHFDLLESIADSKASLVVYPIQDIFELGGEARINVPGTQNGNWQWRLLQEQWNETNWNHFIDILRRSDRLNQESKS